MSKAGKLRDGDKSEEELSLNSAKLPANWKGFFQIKQRWSCQQQTFGISMGTNCAHLWQMCSHIHMKLILYTIYKKPKTSFNLTFRYVHVDDVLSLSNPKYNDYIDVIYQKELDFKDTKGAPKWANYLDLHLEFDEDGILFT